MEIGDKYKRVSPFVMGTRWDLAPKPLPEVFYTHVCSLCKATTYTEKEFPPEAIIVCNACASTMTNQGDKDPNVDVVWDLPPDLLGRLITEAQKREIPPENYIIGFLEWKTGRDLSQIRLFNREDKQIYIVHKRQ